MIELDGLRLPRLDVGTVLMVAMELEDKHKKGRKFWWRFFAAVLRCHKSRQTVDVIVLDGTERAPMVLHSNRPNTTIHLLSEAEWPDGVHVLRTRAILEGQLEGIV